MSDSEHESLLALGKKRVLISCMQRSQVSIAAQTPCQILLFPCPDYIFQCIGVANIPTILYATIYILR